MTRRGGVQTRPPEDRASTPTPPHPRTMSRVRMMIVRSDRAILGCTAQRDRGAGMGAGGRTYLRAAS